MEVNRNEEVLVIGHKNPDTDSICSAIAYAALKEKVTGGRYVPCRAGYINPETEFVLDYFHQPTPRLMNSVKTQVSDIELPKGRGVSGDLSLKEAWKMMAVEGRVTLAVVDDDQKIQGLITIGDIANSYMNTYGNDVLAVAKTPYRNIVTALEGVMVVGDPNACFERGKVLVAAANMDLLEGYIEENDIVLVGNRYDCQLCAIDMHCGCLVLCAGAPLSQTIRHMAEMNHCAIIQTGLDTYTATRFIHQSMPIRFMMTENVLCFHMDDDADKVKDVMSTKRHRYFPVLDSEDRYYGLISRRNFLGMKGKKVILVDHNEKTQAVDGIESADVLEILDHHRIGNLETESPVYFRNQPLGCTATIIYQMYQEKGVDIEPAIAGLLLAAIISDTLLFRSPTCTDFDRRAAKVLALTAGVDTDQLARQMFTAGSNLQGKTEEEILFQDYKVFNADNKRIGIGQITSVLHDEIETLKPRLVSFLRNRHATSGMDYCFLLITSIMDETSDVVCDCEAAEHILETSFPGAPSYNHVFTISGMVSRKKQFVPAVIAAIKG